MGTSLQEINFRARSLSDTLNTNAVTDPEIMAWANEGLKEAYEMVCTADESAFIGPPFPFSLFVANSVGLPDDFFRLRGVDRNPSAPRPETIPPFNFAERNRQGRRSYRVVGDLIFIEPSAMCAGDYQLWYVPKPNAFTNNGDELSADMSFFDEFIVIFVVIKILKKLQDPEVSAFVPDLEAQKARILEQASRRSGEPETVTDVQPRQCDPFFGDGY